MNKNFRKFSQLIPLLQCILNITNQSQILYLKFGKYYLIKQIPELGIAKKIIHLIETTLFNDEQVRQFIQNLEIIKQNPQANQAKIEFIIYESRRLYVVYEYLDIQKVNQIEQEEYNQVQQIALQQLNKLESNIFNKQIDQIYYLSVYVEKIKRYQLFNQINYFTSSDDKSQTQYINKNQQSNNEKNFAFDINSDEFDQLEAEDNFERQDQNFQNSNSY